MNYFTRPFKNKKAFGAEESDASKMGFSVAVVVVVLFFLLSLFTLLKSGLVTISSANTQQIENENTSIKTN